MTGSKSIIDRKKLLIYATKLFLTVIGQGRDFCKVLKVFHVNSEKIIVIYQSISPTRVNLNTKKNGLLLLVN